MSREKKSFVDDLTKLRRILDNPSDPTLHSLVSKDEPALESIWKQLHGDSSIQHRQPDDFLYKYTLMEPRVFIHPKTVSGPHIPTSSHKVESSASLPEFEMVSKSTPAQPSPSQQELFVIEDLFEVEKVNRVIPEFLEVTANPVALETQAKEGAVESIETPVHDTRLPEWQPVEEKATQPLEQDHSRSVEDVPEFELVESVMRSGQQEKSDEWETSQQEETTVEPSVDFLLVEPTESFEQEVSRRQQREERRTQRKKEKEAKKLKKIELQQLKRGKRQQEAISQQATKGQPFLSKPEENTSSETETTTVQPAAMMVDYNVFHGIACIDDKTAEILYKNGYFSIENIKDATLDDLVQVRGIRRKLAKQIKKEIEQKSVVPDTTEFVPLKQRTTKKRATQKPKDTTEWESNASPQKKTTQTSPLACIYQGYTLYRRETKKHGGKIATIHFFSKEKPDKGHPCQLPEGYQIAVNKKTGVPYIKKTH